MRRWIEALLIIGIVLGGVVALEHYVRATVSEVSARDDYTASGSASFTYNFRIVDEGDIAVYDNGVLQTLDTDYTVSGVGNSSGTVTFVTTPTSGHTITLLRAQPVEQSSAYVKNEGFPSTRVEKDYDKNTMVDQMQQEQLGRSLHVPPESTLTGAQTEVPVETCASKYIMWNATTTGFDCSTLTSEGTLADPVQPDHGGTGRDNLTGSTYGGLPAAGTAGRLARVTDNDEVPLWLDDGSVWWGIPALSSDNLVWKSGTNFVATLDHADSADRTYTFQNADGTIAFTTDVPALFNHSGVTVTYPHWVQDTATLSSGTATVTLTGPAVFTSSSSYLCPALYNATQASQTVTYTRNSGSSITIDSIPATATVEYRCFGN